MWDGLSFSSRARSNSTQRRLIGVSITGDPGTGPNVRNLEYNGSSIQMDTVSLGRSDLQVSRLGVGAMTWGDARGLARLHPSKTAYGGSHGPAAEQAALEASVAAGVILFDTAAMYGGGASERRLGELARGKEVVLATKFPSSLFARTESLPETLDASLARLGRVDLYQHHFPVQLGVHPAAHGSDGRCRRGGQDQGRGRQQLFGGPDAGCARSVGQAWRAARLESGRVLALAPPA